MPMKKDSDGVAPWDAGSVEAALEVSFDTKYYFKIVSGGVVYDNGGKPWLVETAKLRSGIPGMHKVIGYLYMDGGVGADGTIAYMTIDGSMSLSYIVQPSGYFQFMCGAARWRENPGRTYKNGNPFEIRFEGANRGFEPLNGGWLTGYNVDTSTFPQNLGSFYLRNHAANRPVVYKGG